jgi:spermidine synthase
MVKNCIMNNPKLILGWYGLTIFLSSAILLVLEIVAGRLIAPYVGVTIYSWTTIIGVILAGLSLGNWLGGVLVDRGFKTQTVGVVLGLSAIFSLLSLYILSFIATILQTSSLDLISSSFFYVLGMFFIPAVLLGIPTPMLTTMALDLNKHFGKIIGRMHALAALGSIIGTFLTGFILIQYIGSRNIIIFSALFLMLLALPFLLKNLKSLMLIIISLVAVFLLADARKSFANPCEVESSYFCIRTFDASDSLPYGEARAMVLDHLMHGINHKEDPTLIASPYVELMATLVDEHFGDNTLNYYFIGGGAYTQPRLAIAKNPANKVVVAEIDPEVTRVAQEKLYVDSSKMQIIHSDARKALYNLDKKFNVVVADAFADIAVPYHLVTKEFIALAKSKMQQNGLFVINIVDIFPNPLMVKSLIKTLESEFKNVSVWLDELPQSKKRTTFVISASDLKLDKQMLYAPNSNARFFDITTPLKNTQTKLSAVPLLTDDFVPVERLVGSLLTTHEGL